MSSNGSKEVIMGNILYKHKLSVHFAQFVFILNIEIIVSNKVLINLPIVIHNTDRVKGKSAFKHAQNAQI